MSSSNPAISIHVGTGGTGAGVCSNLIKMIARQRNPTFGHLLAKTAIYWCQIVEVISSLTLIHLTCAGIFCDKDYRPSLGVRAWCIVMECTFVAAYIVHMVLLDCLQGTNSGRTFLVQASIETGRSFLIQCLTWWNSNLWYLKLVQKSSPLSYWNLLERRSQMFAKEKSQEKLVRFQAEIPATFAEEMEILQTMGGLTSKKALMNEAFALLEWAVEQTIKGNSIASVSKDGEIEERLVMSFLRQVARNTNPVSLLETGTGTDPTHSPEGVLVKAAS